MSSRFSGVLVLSAALLTLAGCDRSLRAHLPGGDAVEIRNIAPDDLKKDSFTMDGLALEGVLLHMTVVSSGGCREHDYALTMTPATFMESHPVQANLYLRHDAHDDPCRAIVRGPVFFDLTPIIELYRQMYGPTGQINLNLYNFEQTGSTRLELHATR